MKGRRLATKVHRVFWGTVPPGGTASLRRSVALNFLAEAFGRGSYFAATVWFARHLGINNFGLLAVAQGTAMLVLVPSELGLSVHGTRLVAGNRQAGPVLVTEIATTRLFLAGSAWLSFALVLQVLGLTPHTAAVFLAAALYLPANAVYCDWYARGSERFGTLAIAGAVGGLTLIVTTLALIRGSQDTLTAALLRPAATVASAAVIISVLRPQLSHVNHLVARSKYHLRASFPIGASNTFNALVYYLGAPVTGLLAGNAVAGTYEAAARIYILISAGGMIVQAALFPRFALLHKKRDTSEFQLLHRRYQLVMAALGATVLLLGVFGARTVITALYTDEYLSSVSVLRVLMVAAGLDMLRYTYGSVLLACGFAKWHVRCSGVAALTLLVTLPFFVIVLGALGAALSLLAATLVNLLLLALAFGRSISDDHLLSLRGHRRALKT